MRVGAVVPVHGEAPYLHQALAGLIGQEPPLAEIVVVDDGSEPPIELPGQDERVRLLRLDANGGASRARGAGVAALDSDWVAFCDSDDVWEPGKLGAQLAALAANPGATVVTGAAVVVGPDGRETGERWAPLPTDGALVAAIYMSNPVLTSSVLITRAAFERAGGFRTRFEPAEDMELWLRLAAAGERFLAVPDARVRYRRHGGGLTEDIARLAAAQLAVREAHAALMPAQTVRRLRARDQTALARGLIRRRDYGGAREALRVAAGLEAPSAKERLTVAILRVPGLRGALGRRPPYG